MSYCYYYYYLYNYNGCCCCCCSNVNFANAPPDSMVNVVLGACHIADPTPPPPSLPTDGAHLFTTPTIPTGIPPDTCQLPLEPGFVTEESVDSVRFGTQPESRYEYNSFPASVNSQYVQYTVFINYYISNYFL